MRHENMPASLPTASARARPAPNASPFYLEPGFYDRADTLLSEIEERLSNVTIETAPFTEQARQDDYRFLTAHGAHVFTRDVLAHLIERLQTWSADTLGASHVSTPQVRVYVDGGWREVLRDEVRAEWHYMLSLTRSRHLRVKVLTEDIVRQADETMTISLGRLAGPRLQFNQLLVHRTGSPYGVEPVRARDPHQAAMLLDGYFW